MFEGYKSIVSRQDDVLLSPAEKKDCSARWQKEDTLWSFSLFGTAVGAGILFLPIQLGVMGLFMVIFFGLLSFPMTYLSHKALCHFVLSSGKEDADITDAAHEHFGLAGGKIFTWLYFLSIYPIMLIYAIGATNTVESFLVYQLDMNAPSRVVLSLLVVFSMVLVLLMGERKIIKATSALVYPLIGMLFFLSIYLMPRWSLGGGLYIPELGDFLQAIWVAIPVLIFSFNHASIISSFAKNQRQTYGRNAKIKADKNLKFTSSILLIFVMFFVVSVVLSLDPSMLADAREQNISVVSYMSNVFNDPVLNVVGPMVALIAILSSFFGHYLGAKEGLNSIITDESKALGMQLSSEKVNYISLAFFIVTLWLAAFLNPSILGLMQKISGPITAIILFMMPVYAMTKVPQLKPSLGYVRHSFIFVVGMVAVGSLVLEVFS